MSIEERFNAAVNVIRGLPKNGPYQPSNEMLLTFYSLFKQATEGKCNAGRPALWNVVNRAKWDAWNRLGDMPKEVAMQKYVDELKKIVETMSYTDNVANFLEYGSGSGNGNDSSDSGVSLNDLEMVAPEAIQKVRSRPNSPIASRDTSPVRASPVPASVNGFHAPPVVAKPLTNGFHHYQNGGGGASSGTQSDLSDDEYIDTVEDSETESTFRPIVANHVSRSRVVQNGPSSIGSEQFHSLGSGSPPSSSFANPEVTAQLARAIDRLNASVQQVNQRINVVEQSVASLRAAAAAAVVPQQAKHVVPRSNNFPPWWPFEEISPRLLALIILWPLVVGRMTAWLQQRRK